MVGQSVKLKHNNSNANNKNINISNIPELFASIVKASPTSIIITDNKGNIEYTNPKFTQLTGYSLDDVIGKNPRILKSGHTKPEEYENLWKTIKIGKEWKGEFHNKKKNGDLYWELASISSIKNNHNKITHYIAIKEDITERKLLEQQKDEFLNIASHELKTPITSIKAYGQILQNLITRNQFEKAGELLLKLDYQTNKLTVLINDLLDITKIQAGNLQFRNDYFNFNSLLNDIVEDMQRTTKRHKLIKELSDDTIIYGDKNRIGQIIINFLSNAIKYSPQANKIIIGTKPNHKNLIFFVKDFGIGIPDNSKDKIFDRYYRLESVNKTAVTGLGLGLYIAQQIALKQHGRIWYENNETKGATFYCSLPTKKQK